jgi:signal transduction histidine kinase
VKRSSRTEAPKHVLATNRRDRWLWILAIGLAIAILLWIVVVFTVDDARFVLLTSRLRSSQIEVASSFARLFAALVLVLFPFGQTRARLQWIAGGFAILGLGGLIFGALYPTFVRREDPNVVMYGSMIFRSMAGILFALGLLPDVPPRISPRVAGAILAVVTALSAGAIWGINHLPVLYSEPSIAAGAQNTTTVLHGLTGWHWGLSLLPVIVAVAAVVGAARHFPETVVPGWLVLAMVLWAGSQIHAIFWPSAYSPVLTSSNLLRLAFSIVVAVGGILTLRQMAADQAALLALEQESTARLINLAALKADFTAMVAHELGSPLAAIRRSADVLTLDPMTPLQTQAVDTIRVETRAITALITDVQALASVERDDFAVVPCAVRVDTLIRDAATVAASLPGDHPFSGPTGMTERVWADPERIGQVLRTLLANAAAYAPPATPIELRAKRNGNALRLEVADHGPGIAPDEVERIFEKYARGREGQQRRKAGSGVGLYLCRRIVAAHGSNLTVESTPGAGAVFGFDLEVIA